MSARNKTMTAEEKENCMNDRVLSPEEIEMIIAFNRIDKIPLPTGKLRKDNDNFFGKCPFCDAGGLTFIIHTKRQLFHCYNCFEGGNVITLVMKLEQIDFRTACEYLANKMGVSFINGNKMDELLTENIARLKIVVAQLEAKTRRMTHARLMG